ncbi:MAG: dihydroorotase [Lachnospiraceae bacterium]|nr:dihydroorotase [Lachnospiraceae bacterium]
MFICVKGGFVYDGHSFYQKDVLVRDGRVFKVSECGAVDFSKCDKVIDAEDKYIFPGFVDVHVHFREPGFSYKETIETGAAAAAAGGYTDVCAMPNLRPVPDSGEHLKEELKLIRAAGCAGTASGENADHENRKRSGINVYPYGSISVGEEGKEIAALEEMAQDVAAFSDDGRGVADDGLMREAMERSKALGKVIAAHCEDMSVIKGSCVHDGKVSKLLGIEGITSESEWKMIERDVRLAEETGCAYHVCHVSAAESVEIIRQAKKRGVNVTCETAPHYLLLCEDDIVARLSGTKTDKELFKGNPDAAFAQSPEKLGRFKMNPPLRARKDMEAVLGGLLDGTIDMIATDHAPHSEEEKAKGLLAGPMGVVGLECAFPILFTKLVREKVISLEKLVYLMSIAPAARFGIECGIKEGWEAKFGIWDLEESYTIDPSKFRSKGRYTPFEGEKVYSRCLMTICGDVIVFER